MAQELLDRGAADPAPKIGVLYVDDEPALLELTTLFLGRAGDLAIDTALSAKLALEKLGVHSYDVIVADYLMPEKDGIEFLKDLRAGGCTIPFIIFTGKGREDVAIEALNSGADFYLQKGGDPRSQFAELGNMIRQAADKRRAEEALRENEQRYRNVVEDQTELICRFLPDGTHIFVNDAYCRYFSMGRDEIIGRRFTPRIPADDRQRIKAHLASLSRESPVATIRHRITMPSGEVRWQSWSDRAIFNEEEEIREFQSVGRDVTDVVKAEEALRESEQQLHAVIQGSPIPQFVIDRYHRVVHWNRALEQHTGIPANEVIGTTGQWRAFYGSERPCLSDLLVDGKIGDLSRWYRGKFAPSRFVDGACEVKDFFPNLGEHGKWLFFTAVAIRDSSGGIIGALETLEDITEQVKAEEDLAQRAAEIEEAHAQLEAIFQAFPDVYIRFDCDGTILDLRTRDPASIFLAYDRLLSRRVRDLLSPVQGTLVEETIQEVHESGQIQIIEFIQEMGGSRFVYEGRFIPLLGSQVIGIFRDITHRKKGEMALQKANEKLQLLSDITRHDILNALTALSAYQDLAMEYSSDPLIHTYLEKQRGLTQLIQGLIEFTRFYQKLGVAAPSWQGIDEILARIIPKLDTGGIPVLFDLQGVEVYADPLLERAFSNLIENAVRHGERVTCIQFGYDENPSGLTVTCEDDGEGIPLSDKEQVFEKGFGRHSGLGLFLVREILSITGLSIRETGEFGRGARFEIHIPQGNYRIPGAPERDVHETALGTADLPAYPTER
ncbi:MAG: PAS domain S-box protein [Methanomicrobiales archaeon]|nr:PAS domain S-box protein [Methanomicrobiales archaeon]